MCNNNSQEKKKKDRQFHKYSKTDPIDPGPYDGESIPEKNKNKPKKDGDSS